MRRKKSGRLRHGGAGWDEGEGRLGERDVGRGLLLQLPQTQMTAPAPCGKHRSEVQPWGLVLHPPARWRKLKRHMLGL